MRRTIDNRRDFCHRAAARRAFEFKRARLGHRQRAIIARWRAHRLPKKTAQGWRIYTARSDGSAQKALSNGPKNDVEPSWRGDNGLVAFASDRGGNYDLYAVRPDGTSLRQITKTTMDERAPQWSPHPFGLFKPDDYAVTDHGVMGRKKSDVGPGELKLLEMLAKNKGDSGEGGWEDYKAKFDLKAVKRYYKLLCVEGSGDKRQIATMRDDGSLRQTLNTGMPGAHLNPSWERSDRFIAFSRRVGQQTAIIWPIIPTPVISITDRARSNWALMPKNGANPSNVFILPRRRLCN